MFSLFQIERDASNKITKATLIETIWVKYNASNEVTEIQYNLSGSTSGYTCVYDIATMNTLSQHGAAYYFELPVKAGDYALGSVAKSNGSAYLSTLT